MYKADDALPAYVRQNNISATRQRGLVLELAEKNDGEVTSSEVMDLLGLSYISAYRLLKKMEDEGIQPLPGRITQVLDHLGRTTWAVGLGVAEYSSTARCRSSGPDIRRFSHSVSKKTPASPNARKVAHFGSWPSMAR